MTSFAPRHENTSTRRDLPVEPTPERTFIQKLGIGFQPPAQAEYGPDAYPSLLRRVTSVFLLIALLVFLGVAVAGSIGAVMLVAGFLLEQAISG